MLCGPLGMSEISFGDRVRVLSTPFTEELGIAGVVGQVYGQTVPSASGVEVQCPLTEDYAVNVFIEAKDEGFWLAEGCLEFVDHGPGTTFSLAGQEWVRLEDGSVQETDDSKRRQQEAAASRVQAKSPWWKLW